MSDVSLQIAGNKAVSSLGRHIAKLDEFAHDYANSSVDVGAVVKMPVLSSSAALFDASTNNYENGGSATEAAITVSAQYLAGFGVTPQQWSDGLGAFNGLFEQMGENAGRAVARSVEDAVVGQVKAGSTTKAASIAQTKTGFTSLYKECIENNLDPENCILVLNPTAYSKMLDTINGTIVNMQSAIETGYIDNFLGFKRVLCSKSVDAGYIGFIAEYGAIGIVGRKIPLLDNYPIYGEFVDANTGIPMTLLGHQRLSDGKWFINATALFGTNIVDPDGLVLLSANA